MIVRPQIWTFAEGVMALTAGALFVSSFTRSSLHALLTTPMLAQLKAQGVPVDGKIVESNGAPCTI